MFDSSQQTFIPDVMAVDKQQPIAAPQQMDSAGQGLADGLQAGAKLGMAMKPAAKKVEGGNPAADVGVTKNFVNSSGGVSQAQQSAMPVKDIATGAMQNPVSSSASKGLGSVGGGGGGTSGGSSTAMAGAGPFALMAALITGANVAHNKDISPWSETAKGQLASNTVDYYQGRKDGKDHGVGSKILDEDGMVGQNVKAATDLGTLDFSNAWKNAKGGIKSAFKGKIFG